LVEGALEIFALMVAFIGPFLGMWVKVVVTLVSTY
jgi:hypothetical protein